MLEKYLESEKIQLSGTIEFDETYGVSKNFGGLNFGGQVISQNLRDDFLVDFIPFPFSLS